MLVLTRKLGEKIIIQTPTGETIAIAVDRNTKVNITAPAAYLIVREELIVGAEPEATIAPI